MITLQHNQAQTSISDPSSPGSEKTAEKALFSLILR
jgi:hypothetical protein